MARSLIPVAERIPNNGNKKEEIRQMKTGEEKWFSTMFVCFVTRFSSDNLLMIMINLTPLTTQSLILVMTGNDSIGGN